VSVVAAGRGRNSANSFKSASYKQTRAGAHAGRHAASFLHRDFNTCGKAGLGNHERGPQLWDVRDA
jgi:hypothetical protein